jgi:hypothetical protein
MQQLAEEAAVALKQEAKAAKKKEAKALQKIQKKQEAAALKSAQQKQRNAEAKALKDATAKALKEKQVVQQQKQEIDRNTEKDLQNKALATACIPTSAASTQEELNAAVEIELQSRLLFEAKVREEAEKLYVQRLAASEAAAATSASSHSSSLSTVGDPLSFKPITGEKRHASDENINQRGFCCGIRLSRYIIQCIQCILCDP